MTETRPRILILCTSLGTGGAEILLTELVRGLRTEFDIQVGYIKEIGAAGAALRKLGIEPRHMPTFWRLLRLVKKWRPQLIHTYLYRDRIYGRLAGFLTGTPVISSHYARDDWRSWPLVWLDRLTASFSCRTITNSNSTRDLLVKQEGIPEPRITLIAPGLPADFQPGRLTREEARATLDPAPAPGPIVGTVSRLHREKGSDFWPQIAEGILKEVPKAQAYLVGDGPLRKSVAAEIEKRGLSGRVHLLGWVADIGAFLSALDLFVLSSREESFSQALLEAAAAGVPFAAFDVGGNFELVDMGAVGSLVSPENIPEMIKTCVRSLSELPALAARAGEQRSRIQKQASMEKMTRETAGLYRKVLLSDLV